MWEKWKSVIFNFYTARDSFMDIFSIIFFRKGDVSWLIVKQAM